MSRVVKVVFISSAVVFGLCSGDSKRNSHLRDEIKRTQEETAKVIGESDKLQIKMDTVSQYCWKQIKEGDVEVEKGTAKNEAQQAVIEELYELLTKSQSVKEELLELPVSIDRLKLGIRVMQENMEVLEKRRANGVSKSCLYLEGMAIAVNVSVPSTLSMGRIGEEIVLENKLRLVKGELGEANYRYKGLKRKFKAAQKICNERIKNIRSMLKKIKGDTEKSDEIIAELKKELKEHKQKVEDLNKAAGATMVEVEKWKKAAKRIVAKYANYAPDVKCYEKLLRGVATLVSPVVKV